MAPETVAASVDMASSNNNNSAAQTGFFSRVSSLPIVHSALQSAKTLYDTSKSKYQLLDQIETSVKARVVPQIQPIMQTLHAYDAQLAQIDSYACTGLDLLENQLPIIKEPTDKVIETTRALVDERIISPVKNVTVTLSRSIEDGKHKLDATTNTYVANVVSLSENIADRILGPDENAENTVPANASTYARVQHLGQSVTTRLTKRARTAASTAAAVSANLPTAADLRKLVIIADLVQYSQKILAEQIAWLDQSIAASQKQLSLDQQQLSASASTLAQNLVHTLSATSTVIAAYLPESVRAQSSRLQTLLQQQLAHLHQIQINNRDSIFFQKLSEAAATGQKYLHSVTTHLSQLYTLAAASTSKLSKPATTPNEQAATAAVAPVITSAAAPAASPATETPILHTITNGDDHSQATPTVSTPQQEEQPHHNEDHHHEHHHHHHDNADAETEQEEEEEEDGEEQHDDNEDEEVEEQEEEEEQHEDEEKKHHGDDEVEEKDGEVGEEESEAPQLVNTSF